MKNKFKTIYIFSFVLLISLSSLYIFQIISYTEESYLLQEYQNKKDSIFKKALSYDSFASPSLDKVERVAQEMDFRQVNGVNYIHASGRDIVAR